MLLHLYNATFVQSLFGVATRRFFDIRRFIRS